MAVKCTNCGGAHPSWDCSKPTKSTEAQKVATVTTVKEFDPPASVETYDVTVQLYDEPFRHVDTHPKPKMGRPRTGYIKAEYNRQYSADQRTIKRLGLNCTVKEWRESLK